MLRFVLASDNNSTRNKCSLCLYITVFNAQNQTVTISTLSKQISQLNTLILTKTLARSQAKSRRTQFFQFSLKLQFRTCTVKIAHLRNVPCTICITYWYNPTLQ